MGLLLLPILVGWMATAAAAFLVPAASRLPPPVQPPPAQPAATSRSARLASGVHATAAADDDRGAVITVGYDDMTAGPHVDRLKRRARRRALQLALRQRLGRLYVPLVGWLDRRWERRWRAFAEGGGWEAEVCASVVVAGEQGRETPSATAAAATWVVDGPALPSSKDERAQNDQEDADKSYVLVREPAQRNVLRRWLARGWGGLRKRLRRRAAQQHEKETVEEWGLYRGREGEGTEGQQQLGRIGLRFRRPRGRALTDFEREAARVFGDEVYVDVRVCDVIQATGR